MKDSRDVRQEAEPCFPIAISHAHPQYKKVLVNLELPAYLTS